MVDVDSILQEVIDSACALTGARYGALLTFGESGDLGDLIPPVSPPRSAGGWEIHPRGSVSWDI